MKSNNFKTLLAAGLMAFTVACSGGTPEAGGNNNNNNNNNNNPFGNQNGGANNGITEVAGNPDAVCANFGGGIQETTNVMYRCIDSAGTQGYLIFDGTGVIKDEFGVNNIGTYEVTNGQVHAVLPGLNFDRTSIQAEAHLGMLGRFTFNDDQGNFLVACGAIQHNYDPQAIIARYDCPFINVLPNYDEHPVFDFAPATSQANNPNFGQPERGFAFWSTQIQAGTSTSNRDYYGIYRQTGNTICGYFPFARTADQNVRITVNGAGDTITVHRPEYNTGDCRRQ